MFDIIGKRFWYFSISGIIILAGIISLFVFGLQPGIEFKSGSEISIEFDNPVEKQQVTQALSELGYDDVVVRQAGADYILSLPEINDADKAALRTGMVARF